MKREVIIELQEGEKLKTYSDMTHEKMVLALNTQPFVCIGNLIVNTKAVSSVKFIEPNSYIAYLGDKKEEDDINA